MQTLPQGALGCDCQVWTGGDRNRLDCLGWRSVSERDGRSGSSFDREIDYLRQAFHRIQGVDRRLRHIQSGVEARSGRTSVSIPAALQRTLAGLGEGSEGSSNVRFASRRQIRLADSKGQGRNRVRTRGFAVIASTTLNRFSRIAAGDDGLYCVITISSG